MDNKIYGKGVCYKRKRMSSYLLLTSDAGDGSNNRRYNLFIQDNYKTLILRIIIYNTNAILPAT